MKQFRMLALVMLMAATPTFAVDIIETAPAKTSPCQGSMMPPPMAMAMAMMEKMKGMMTGGGCGGGCSGSTCPVRTPFGQ